MKYRIVVVFLFAEIMNVTLILKVTIWIFNT